MNVMKEETPPGESGVRFWGAKAVCHSKYRYIRHTIGAEERTVWVKIPNVVYMRKLILARKLLRMKYSLEFCRNVKQVNPKDEDKSKRGLDRRKQTSYKYACRRLKEEFSRKGELNKTGKKLRNPNEEADAENHDQNQNPNQNLLASNNLRTDSEPDDKDEINNGITSRHNEGKVRLKSRRKIKESVASHDHSRVPFRNPDVLEVWANMKLFSENSTETSCSLLIRLMEIMRIGIYKHDWALVSKCAEGLAEEAKRNSRSAFWILWNGGSLALANIFRNDMDKIIELGLLTRSLIPSYPKRIAVEVATWLTQHGDFLKAIDIIKEWDITGKHVFNSVRRYCDNSKRYQTDLVALMFIAAHSYALWKRDMDLLDRGLYIGDSISVRRSGEAALIQFQLVAEMAEKSGAEVTIFIKPLVELVMEFKTEFDARKLFLNYVEKHRRNYILQELYLEFLEKYFPFLTEEIEVFTQHRKLYCFNKKRDSIGNLMKLRTWRNNAVLHSTERTFTSFHIPLKS